MSSDLKKLYAEAGPRQLYQSDFYTDEEAYYRLVGGRSRLLRSQPFMGICAIGMPLVETTIIPTAGVDGFHLFYNPKFVRSLSFKMLEFLTGHEVYHCLAKHLIREDGRDHELWNKACDYVANDTLIESNCGDKIPNILYDRKFHNMTAEAVYDLLPPDPPGSTVDVHIVHPGLGSSIPDGAGGSTTVQDAIAHHWDDIIVEAAAAQQEAEARGAGKLPAGLSRFLTEIATPRMNWRAYLRRYTRMVLTQQFSYARPNKGLFNMGWTIPGFRGSEYQLDLAVGVDLSGSINNDDHKAFWGELLGITKAFSTFRITAWTFDGDVYDSSYTEITHETKDPIITFAKAAEGGGGTSFESNWVFMKRRKIKPQMFCMFTDGCPNNGWGDAQYCPTMFLVKGTTNKAPFGITVFYD